MKIKHLHEWDLAPQEAIALQNELATQLRDEPIDLAGVKTVAGVDVSVKDGVSQAAVVVATYPEMQVLEIVRTKRPTDYPYIPGLLTFREGAVLVEAFEQLQHEPDVFVFDGMGRIHPRKMGIAAHLGLWLDKPSLGVGKTHFIGEYAEPAETRGAYTDLLYKGEKLGVVLRTKDKVKPVYISVGQRASIETAIDLVLAVSKKYRLPEPIRLAHGAAGQYGDSKE